LLLILIPFVFATNLERFANEEGFPCKNELPSLTIGDHHVTEILRSMFLENLNHGQSE
jgi:hypothetical protein